MSIDYPEYQNMKKDSTLAGVIWQIGDKLYYMFMVGGLIAVLITLSQIPTQGMKALTNACLVTLISVFGFMSGVWLKKLSYKIWKSKSPDSTP